METLRNFVKTHIVHTLLVPFDPTWQSNNTAVFTGTKLAKIFEEDAEVCTRDNRDNCFNPTSINDAFRPLGIYAKIFGLFPKYDMVSGLHKKKIKIFLDYMYSILVLLFVVLGGIACQVKPPIVLDSLEKDTADNQTDFTVTITIMYLTMSMGIVSMFLFPCCSTRLMGLIQRFSDLDKILRFDGRDQERNFVRRVIFHKVSILLLCFLAYTGYYILEPDGTSGHSGALNFTDYLMVPVMTLSVHSMLVPMGTLVFFMNAVSLRLFHFNKLIRSKVNDVIPSTSICSGMSDYGKELDDIATIDKSQHLLACQMEKLRILHAEVRSIVVEIGCIFGGYVTRDVLYSTAGLVLYTYTIVFVNYTHSVSNFVIIILFDGFLIVKLITLANFAQAIDCYRTQTKAILNKVSLSRVTPEASLQIQMFLQALSSPIQLSASGFFIVERKLITSIFGAITTYFIILIQFKTGDMRTGTQDTCDCSHTK